MLHNKLTYDTELHRSSKQNTTRLVVKQQPVIVANKHAIA